MSFWNKIFGGQSEEEKFLDEISREIYFFLNDDDEQNKTMPPLLRANITEGRHSFVPNGEGAFGRDIRNPIPCNGIVGEVTYLSRMVLEYEVDGETEYQGFTFHRLGSIDCIDVYEIISYDGRIYDKLYLNMYYEYKSDYVPLGYNMRDSLALIRGISELNNNFPYQQAEYAAAWAEGHTGMPVYDQDLSKIDFKQAVKSINLMRASEGTKRMQWW